MGIRAYLVSALSYLKQPGKRRLIKAAIGLKGQKGLEVGGPSNFFRLKSGFPVYPFARQIDGVNFSTDTVWEGKISEGQNYLYGGEQAGFQFIAEATDLSQVSDGHYDFLLSCHSLEHVANPIKALKEWNRVVKKGGTFVLVLPDKRYTFDLRRPYTTFEHLLQDFEQNRGEDDSTHFDEIIRLHDVSKDPARKPTQEVSELLKLNHVNRLAHHHVFDEALVAKALSYSGFEVYYQTEIKPFHLVALARKI